MLKITNLRVNYGKVKGDFRYRIIDNKAPVFSWSALSDQENSCQSKYKITVCNNDNCILWDSGWVESLLQEAKYEGNDLPVGEKINISLEIQDNKGNFSKKLEEYLYCGCIDSWNAKWIRSKDDVQGKAVYFRKNINIKDEIKYATLFVCGIGYHKVYINGKSDEIDSSFMSPAHSDYSKTCYYNVIPVENALTVGENNIGIMLGEGWRRNEGDFLNGAIVDRKIEFYGVPQLTACLKIVYISGKEEWIYTDESWKHTHGAITANNIFDGECFNANECVADWSTRELDDKIFSDVVLADKKDEKMIAQALEPIVEKEIYKPISVSQIGTDTYVVDFGQNIAGVPRIKLPTNMIKNQKITISHMEFLDEDGSLYMAPLRGAKATDTYIASGDKRDLQQWQPLFVYHGFRYAQVKGYNGVLTKDDILAVSLYTDISTSSYFTCGNALVNQIQKNIVQTEKANMHSILTDCPQRDERMAWMNDATVRFEETPYNFDIGRMFPKIICDLLDTQGEDGAITCTAPYVYGSRPADPVSSSFLVAGMQSVLHTGNTRFIGRCYDGYRAWEKCLENNSTDFIVDYSYYGDWAGPAYACEGEDGAKSLVTPGIFMSTGYYYFNARLLSEFAEILGKNDDVTYYKNLAENIKEAMLKKWFDENTCIVATGSQACQAFSLWLGILPEECEEKAARIMRDDLLTKDYKFTTGNLCTRYLFDMLTKFGYVNEAWELINKEEYPSFGYMIENEATTIWERFELKKAPGMNSHNHPMFGAVGYWFYAYIAGIKPVSEGFNEIVVKPYFPEKLLSAHACVDSVKGDVVVRWVKRYGKVHIYVTVPFGAKASIVLPHITENVGSGFWHYEWDI